MKVLPITDIGLRDLISLLEENGESFLAQVLSESVISAEQAHRKAIEDMNETERLEMEEEDFQPDVNPIDEAIIKAYDLLQKQG